MSSQVPPVLGFVAAMGARERSFSSVGSQVLLESRHEAELPRAEGTHEVIGVTSHAPETAEESR